ncbi:MAG: aminotransferase class V-fold PLP-dependent enzyme [Alphaproteobacteria bacterium]
MTNNISMGARRRAFLKLMAATPLFATMATQSFAKTVAGKANAYEQLGIRPLINARGTYTYVGGSLELPVVRAAVEAASHQFVDMFELQHAAGKRLAEISGAEFGMVTSGAAAAMSTAVAAVIAGTDPDKIWQLPDTTGLKNEVVMLGGRNAFDSALRLAGGKLVLAPTLADLPGAIGPKTCLVYTTFRDERVQDALKVTKPAGVPLLVDASSSVPPFENFTKFAKWGVDLYAISGGKGLGGPQCSGLLLGRKDLIEAGMANSAPWEGAVCRAMKVGKEEIMGILAAVEYWSKADLNVLNKEWQGRVERVAKLAETVPGVTTSIEIPVGSNSYPTLTVNWDEAAFGLTVAQCVEELAAGTPRIEALSTLGNRSLIPPLRKPKVGVVNKLQVVSMTLQPGEDLIVGRRIREVLNKARKARA